MLGPKNPLLLTMVAGFTNGTVSCHNMSRRDASVQSVGKYRDGAHGDFALNHPAGPQPLGDAHTPGAQAPHSHR